MEVGMEVEVQWNRDQLIGPGEERTQASSKSEFASITGRNNSMAACLRIHSNSETTFVLFGLAVQFDGKLK